MTPAALERALRRLPSSALLEAADALRKAALLLDRGRPDDGLAALAAAAELLAGSSSPQPSSDAITLLDRARFDLEHGWHAAAYDAAVRAVRMIEMEAHHGR
jgi:HEPN domain-containing protein